jgi:hypothetical protein
MTTKKTAARQPRQPQPVSTGKAKEALAVNLADWLEGFEKSVATLAEKSRVSKKTIYNMKNATYDPISKIEAVAQAFGKEAWIILCPAPLADLAEVMRVFNRADDQGKRDIEVVTEIVRRRIEGDQKPSP